MSCSILKARAVIGKANLRFPQRCRAGYQTVHLLRRAVRREKRLRSSMHAFGEITGQPEYGLYRPLLPASHQREIPLEEVAAMGRAFHQERSYPCVGTVTGR